MELSLLIGAIALISTTISLAINFIFYKLYIINEITTIINNRIDTINFNINNYNYYQFNGPHTA